MDWVVHSAGRILDKMSKAMADFVQTGKAVPTRAGRRIASAVGFWPWTDVTDETVQAR